MEGYAFDGVNNFRMDDFNALDAAQRLIDELQKEYDRMTTINIVVAGKTGSGKSTLINNVFREKMAETGTGIPITQEINKIEKEGFPLRIYDTPGLELGGQNSTETLVGEIQDRIEKSIQTGQHRRHDGSHSLLCRVQRCTSKPSGFVFRRELGHKHLEQALAFHLRWLQQILHEFEYRNDVSALHRVFCGWRQIFRQQQDH